MHTFNKVQNKNTNKSEIDNCDPNTACHYLHDLKMSIHSSIPELVLNETKEAVHLLMECYQQFNGQNKGATLYMDATGVSAEQLMKLPIFDASGL